MMASTIDDPEQHEPWGADPRKTSYMNFGAAKPLGEQYLMKAAVGSNSDLIEYKWRGKVEFWIGKFIGRLVINKETNENWWDCRIAWWSNRRAEQYLGYTVRIYDEQVEI